LASASGDDPTATALSIRKSPRPSTQTSLDAVHARQQTNSIPTQQRDHERWLPETSGIFLLALAGSCYFIPGECAAFGTVRRYGRQPRVAEDSWPFVEDGSMTTTECFSTVC